MNNEEKNLKVLIVRGFPNKMNLNSYNIQEIGLSKALRRRGVECDIVFYNGSDNDTTQVLEDGTTIYWMKAINIFKNGIFLHLSKIINNYDVIQVHEYDQLQSWLLYTFSHKKIVIYHGPYYDKFNKGYNLKCKVFDTLFLPFSKRAKGTVPCLTKSHFAADFLRNKGFKNVIPVGVGLDTDMLQQDGALSNTDNIVSTDSSTINTSVIDSNKSTSNSDNNYFTALYVGILEERRNISFLLDLAEKLHEENNSFNLTIVGKFGDAEYKAKIGPRLEKLVEQGIITYIESLTQKQLPALYKVADLFLFTSNYEIFGMVLLEAMYYGAVPASSLNGGSKTLIAVGVDGLILDNYDVDAWSSRILDLVKNREQLDKFKSNAHDKIANQFTWDALAEKFIECY